MSCLLMILNYSLSLYDKHRYLHDWTVRQKAHINFTDFQFVTRVPHGSHYFEHNRCYGYYPPRSQDRLACSKGTSGWKLSSFSTRLRKQVQFPKLYVSEKNKTLVMSLVIGTFIVTRRRREGSNLAQNIHMRFPVVYLGLSRKISWRTSVIQRVLFTRPFLPSVVVEGSSSQSNQTAMMDKWYDFLSERRWGYS